MRFVLKREFRGQLASGKAVFGVEVSEGEPQTLRTGRGTLVSTSHLLAMPTGALEKLGGKVIVFGSQPPPFSNEERLEK